MAVARRPDGTAHARPQPREPRGYTLVRGLRRLRDSPLRPLAFAHAAPRPTRHRPRHGLRLRLQTHRLRRRDGRVPQRPRLPRLRRAEKLKALSSSQQIKDDAVEAVEVYRLL